MAQSHNGFYGDSSSIDNVDTALREARVLVEQTALIRDDAILIRNDVESLRDNTILVSDGVEAQASDAANSASNSAGSATQSANSAFESASAASAAASSATTASTHASNAADSAASASTSAATATTKASEVVDSATSAANSATTATTKASEASTSATNAAASASTATTKASEASASATGAANSASSASGSATAASNSASSAQDSAFTASQSEITSVLQADRAQTQADRAVLAAETAFPQRRNLIINGGFDINQRGGVDLSNNAAYGPDRWRGTTNGFTARLEVGSNNYSRSRRHGILRTKQQKTTLTASDFLTVLHRIEGVNLRGLGWGTATAEPAVLSFRARSVGFTGDVSICLRAGSGGAGFVTTVNVTNTQQKFVINIPGPTFGVFGSSIDVGAELLITMAAPGDGNNVAPSVNTWTDSINFVAPTQVNGSATSENELHFTEVQLERGNVATPFEMLPFGESLSLCQRYYCQVNAYSTGQFTEANQVLGVPAYWPVTMRGTPSVGLGGVITGSNVSSENLFGATTNGVKYQINSSGSGQGFVDNRLIVADAEL